MREVKNSDSMEKKIEDRTIIDRFDVIVRPIVFRTTHTYVRLKLQRLIE